jgi:geranylgeranyl reductase family protein
MHTIDYDVVIAGGGLAGLLAAREAASKGLKVAVFEEDLEIGVPDKCDGLVSMGALMSLGVIPRSRAVQNTIKRALIYPPSGKPIEVEVSKLKVVVLNREVFDKDLAKAASSKGAEIILGGRVAKAVEEEGCVRVEANHVVKSNIYVEAKGASALPAEKQRYLIPAARYDIEAKWVEEDAVEVHVDSTKYPSFFLWIISTGKDSAKLGVAGRSINCFAALDEFLKQRGGGYVIKRVSAPIYVGGPINSFVKGRVVVVGDSAGQTKPSTGGGIYSCGLAGIFAGQAAAKYLLEGDPAALQKYSRSWLSLFKEDFRITLLARRIYEKMDNRSIEKIFNLIRGKNLLNDLLQEDGFDEHSKWIKRCLSVEDLVKIFSIVAAEEFRSLIKQVGDFLAQRR